MGSVIPAARESDSGLSNSSSSIRFVIKEGYKEAEQSLGRRFRGEGLYKVDSKGRVSIPALFRRVIESCDPNGQRACPQS